MREGNNILGVYACNPDRPPVAIRYLVDLAVPGAEITVSRNGKKYMVCSSLCYVWEYLYISIAKQ